MAGNGCMNSVHRSDPDALELFFSTLKSRISQTSHKKITGSSPAQITYYHVCVDLLDFLQSDSTAEKWPGTWQVTWKRNVDS